MAASASLHFLVVDLQDAADDSDVLRCRALLHRWGRWGPHERQRWDVPTRLGNDSHKIWEKHGKSIRKKVFFAGKIIALFLGDFPAIFEKSGR